VVRPRTSSMLERDAPPMLCMRLCARARDTFDSETCELCRELAPLPVPPDVDPELVCRERERDLNAPPILASEAVLPLREPSREARGLGCEDGGESRPTESSRSRASSEPSGDGWPERDGRSSSRSDSGNGSEPTLVRRCWPCSPNACCCRGRVAVRAPAGVGDAGTGKLPARWRPLAPAAGWRGGMGMPRTGSCGLGADELGGAAEMGEPPAGEEEVVAVSTLPVLRVSWDARVDVLLLCGVAAERVKGKGGEPVDEMLPPRAGWRNENGYRLGMG